MFCTGRSDDLHGKDPKRQPAACADACDSKLCFVGVKRFCSKCEKIYKIKRKCVQTKDPQPEPYFYQASTDQCQCQTGIPFPAISPPFALLLGAVPCEVSIKRL